MFSELFGKNEEYKLPKEPWQPVPYHASDAAAIQALAIGEATPEQQQRALDWIVQIASGTFNQSFYPNDPRFTDFAEGRRFVGNSIIKLTRLNVSTLRRGENEK